MKKSAIISLVLAIIIMGMMMTGCSSSKSQENKQDVSSSNGIINKDKEDEQQEVSSVTKEQCMEIAKYGMDIAIAQMQGNEKQVQELSEKVMVLEKKYELEGTQFEKKCEPYMMDQEFLNMIQQQGMMLQNAKK